MIAFGIILMVAGAGSMLAGILQDPSVVGDLPSGRVANFSLMNAKSLWAELGGALFVGGCVFAVGGMVRNAIADAREGGVRSPEPKRPVTPPRFGSPAETVSPTDASSRRWAGRRSLADPAYREHLLNRYPASEGGDLSRDGRSFATEDELLHYLDEKDRGLWPDLGGARPPRG